MKHTSIIILLVLMLLSCGNKQRQGLYYGNYGYGYGDKATQDTLVEDQELPINDRKAKAPVDNSFSPVPSNYSSDTNDEAVPGEFGDNHGLIDDEGYLQGGDIGYGE